MWSEVLLLLLLTAGAASGQDLPLDFVGLLGGLELRQGLGGWLNSLTAAQNRKVYNSLVSTTALQAAYATRPDSGRLVGYGAVCNHTTCCSTRTSVSIAHRAALSASRLGPSAPPPLLACGPSPASPAAAPVPCHPPLASQPLFRAFRTRCQLSLHTLRNKVLQLGGSAAAALSSSTRRISAPAWLRLMHPRQPPVLALPPSNPAPPEPLDTQQVQPSEAVDEPDDHNIHIRPAADLLRQSANAAREAATSEADAAADRSAVAKEDTGYERKLDGEDAAWHSDQFTIPREEQSPLGEAAQDLPPLAPLGGSSWPEECPTCADVAAAAAPTAAAVAAGAGALATEAAPAREANQAPLEAHDALPQATLSGLSHVGTEARRPADAAPAAAAEPDVAIMAAAEQVGGQDVRVDMTAVRWVEASLEAKAPAGAPGAVADWEAVTALGVGGSSQMGGESRVLETTGAHGGESQPPAAALDVPSGLLAPAQALSRGGGAVAGLPAREALGDWLTAQQLGTVAGGAEANKTWAAAPSSLGVDGMCAEGPVAQVASADGAAAAGSGALLPQRDARATTQPAEGGAEVVEGGAKTAESGAAVAEGGAAMVDAVTAAPAAAAERAFPLEETYRTQQPAAPEATTRRAHSPSDSPFIAVSADGSRPAAAGPPSSPTLGLRSVVQLSPRGLLAMCITAAAVLVAALQVTTGRAARRRALSLNAALDNVHQEHARSQEQLRSQHETLVSELLGVTNGLRDHLAEARDVAERQRAGRRAAVCTAATAVRARAAAAVQLAQQVSELQRVQAELAGAVAAAVREWRQRGEVLTAALGRCRREAERVVRSAAAERAAVEERFRRQVEERVRAAAAAEEAHARELAELQERFGEELVAEQRRHAATATAARAHRAQYDTAIRQLRRRQCRNLAAWLALRSCVGLQVEVLSERAGTLASEHSAVLAECRSLVEQHRVRADVVQQQLAEQVAVVVETNRTNHELMEVLEDKNSAIMELEGELAAANLVLKSQRQQGGDLQRLLTATEESLTASQREVVELEAGLREAQVASQLSEARADRLAAANQLLEQQVSQFVKTVNMLVQMEEAHLAPTRTHAAALERQMVAEREAAEAALAERDAKLVGAAADLAQARRETEAAQRSRGEVAKRLEECERELRAVQSELGRREEEGVETGAMAFTAAKQSPLRDQHRDHRDHRDRDQEAVLQQLLGPLAGLSLPLPADTKALLTAASPASAAAVAAAASAGSLTPGAGDRGGGARGGGSTLSFGAAGGGGLRK